MLAFEDNRRGLRKAVGCSGKKGGNGEEEEERDHWIGWNDDWNEVEEDRGWDWEWDWDNRVNVAADSDDVTGENGLQHYWYWHYWSGRRRLNVGHSCYLGMMPWPIEKMGSVYNRASKVSYPSNNTSVR